MSDPTHPPLHSYIHSLVPSGYQHTPPLLRAHVHVCTHRLCMLQGAVHIWGCFGVPCTSLQSANPCAGEKLPQEVTCTHPRCGSLLVALVWPVHQLECWGSWCPVGRKRSRLHRGCRGSGETSGSAISFFFYRFFHSKVSSPT